MSASWSGLAEQLAWVDPWLLPVDAAWSLPISRLEAVASLLALAMVGFNLRVNPVGWPLAIASSALYALLFARSRLYGEAALWVRPWAMFFVNVTVDGVAQRRFAPMAD